MPADDRTLRVMHFKKNGINLGKDKDEVAQEMAFLEEYNVGCWRMVEPNLNLTQRQTRETAQQWF